MDFSETIAASDLKVSWSRHLIEYMKICEYWRSRLFLGQEMTLAKSSVHTKIQTGFSQKLLCRSKPNFVWKLSGARKWNSYDMMLVTWPRWPPRPYMVKTLQNSSLRNRQANFYETWYVALGTPAHHSLFKWWPWSDLDLFYSKVQFGNLGFSIGKSENSGFFRKYCSQWPESC